MSEHEVNEGNRRDDGLDEQVRRLGDWHLARAAHLRYAANTTACDAAIEKRHDAAGAGCVGFARWHDSQAELLSTLRNQVAQLERSRDDWRSLAKDAIAAQQLAADFVKAAIELNEPNISFEGDDITAAKAAQTYPDQPTLLNPFPEANINPAEHLPKGSGKLTFTRRKTD